MTKPGPKLPSKKNWDTYRRWKGWSEPSEADYTLGVRRVHGKHKSKKRNGRKTNASYRV